MPPPPPSMAPPPGYVPYGGPGAFSPFARVRGIAKALVILQIATVVATAVLFLVRRDDWSARWLLRASLIYLTCWMGLLIMVAV